MAALLPFAWIPVALQRFERKKAGSFLRSHNKFLHAQKPKKNCFADPRFVCPEKRISFSIAERELWKEKIGMVAMRAQHATNAPGDAWRARDWHGASVQF